MRGPSRLREGAVVHSFQYGSGGSSKIMAASYWMQAFSVMIFAVLLGAARSSAQGQPQLNLMPVPAHVQLGNGSLRIDSSFSVALTGHTEARLDHAVQRFQRQLSLQTAIPFPAKAPASSRSTLEIHTDHGSKDVQELGEDESYV